MKVQKGMKVAVFTRNHRKYLDEAVLRNQEDPVRQTTFRSAKRWVGAYHANAKLGPLKIYFAPVGGDNGIEYQADLTMVHLDPNTEDPVTREVLASELDSTKSEGLWEKYSKSVKTLYVISRCERLSRPFPISELIKLSDDTFISKDFGYSYALVNEHFPLSHIGAEINPEEIEDHTRYFEGATKTVSVNVYERSAAARKACILHYGCLCSVCGFDFEKTYGEIGSGFIHVHHMKSLADIDDTYEVDAIQDLRPVCPNCHSMLHKSDPVLSIEDLRARIAAGTQ
jgi:predicted HNH restriction endonuclease